MNNSVSFRSLNRTVRGLAVHCLCATFHRKLVQVVEEAGAEEEVAEVAEEVRAAPCRAHRTEAFKEVFPLAIQNPVDGFPQVL